MDLIMDGIGTVPRELGMGFGKRKLKMTKKAIAARAAYRRRARGSPKRRRSRSPGRRRKSPVRRRSSAKRVYKGCPGSRTCSQTEKYIDMLEGRVTVNSQKANRLERDLQNLKSKDINDAKKLAAVKKLQKSIRARNAKRSKLASDAEDDFDAYSAVWGSSFGRRLKMTKKAIAARAAYRRRTRGSPKRRRSPLRRRRSRSPVRRRRTTVSQRTYGNIPLSMQDDSDLSVFGISEFGRRLKMTKSAIAARRAYRRRTSPRRRRRSPIRRRRVSPRRGRKMSKRVIYANAKKAMRLHHRTGISLKAAWRKVLGNKRSRFGEDIDDIMSEFGMATVCRPGYSPNRRWRAGRGRGQKRCVKDRTKKITLSELQAIARKNGVQIYKARKSGGGYTKTPVTAKALKARLSKARVSYNYGRKGPGISYV